MYELAKKFLAIINETHHISLRTSSSWSLPFSSAEVGTI
jgi:hypothetical protein